MERLYAVLAAARASCHVSTVVCHVNRATGIAREGETHRHVCAVCRVRCAVCLMRRGVLCARAADATHGRASVTTAEADAACRVWTVWCVVAGASRVPAARNPGPVGRRGWRVGHERRGRVVAVDVPCAGVCLYRFV